MLKCLFIFVDQNETRRNVITLFRLVWSHYYYYFAVLDVLREQHQVALRRRRRRYFLKPCRGQGGKLRFRTRAIYGAILLLPGPGRGIILFRRCSSELESETSVNDNKQN